MRSALVQWKGLTPEAALTDLMEWSRCARAATDPAPIRALLRFEASQVLPSDANAQAIGDPDGSAFPDGAWLSLDAEQWNRWAKEREALETRAQQLESAEESPGETEETEETEDSPREKDLEETGNQQETPETPEGSDGKGGRASEGGD